MRRKQPFLLLAIFLVSCWVSVSCRPDVGEVECTEDQHCDQEAGQTCVDNYCEQAWIPSTGCGAGTIEVGGICVPGCAEDTDCRFPDVCRDGLCSIQFKCESDSGCRHGATCDLSTSPSRCVKTLCSTDAECAANQQCQIVGQCYPRTCDTVADCPVAAGFSCIDRFCVCTGLCG